METYKRLEMCPWDTDAPPLLVAYINESGTFKNVRSSQKQETVSKADLKNPLFPCSEAHGLLSGSKLDPDAGTRGQQKKLETLSEETASPTKKPRMSKATTMGATAKEAKGLLGDNKPDEDAMTSGQQKKIEDIQVEKPAGRKAKLSKSTTMTATAKEGAALLAEDKLGDTRMEAQRKKGKPSGPKRTSTIQKTMEEAKWVVDVDPSEGRKTRSASNPEPPPAKKAKPALKKAGTMEKNN